MRKIRPSLTSSAINIELARILHSEEYTRLSPHGTLINFEVRVAPKQRGIGWLTVPTETIGNYFLYEYGGVRPQKPVSDFRIQFQRSDKAPQANILDSILRLPYVDPRVRQEELLKSDAGLLEVQETQIDIKVIQFGWECRDNVFSVEWEEYVSSATLSLDLERGEFRIKVHDLMETRMIALRAAQIYFTSAGTDKRDNYFIFLSLNHAPSFESESSLSNILNALSIDDRNAKSLRQRNISFNADHTPFAPYTSLYIRLVCHRRADIQSYQFLCNKAHIAVDEFIHDVEYRCLFSDSMRLKFRTWVSNLPWKVAFQVEALSRSHVLDLKEVLTLREPIQRTIESQGVEETFVFLQEFNSRARNLLWFDDGPSASNVSDIRDLYTEMEREYFLERKQTTLKYSEDLFQCLHAIVTPTTVFFEGPFPERSNRVIRQHLANQDSFMRVAFVDENRLAFRFDREVDGRDFVNKRVRKMLRDGLDVSGRHFKFLAYSQSALKEHAVWFVKPFRDPEHGEVNASTIIASLGSFEDLAFDATLIYCPARYGARISQAFTATDSSLTVQAEEVHHICDIKNDKYCFTDGVGTISPELAKAIWAALRAKKGRLGRRTNTYPRAFQVRFQGSKGMLSVNYRLSGDVIGIRPSMIKFDSPDTHEIEIARAFDKPGKFFLNRPLIMLLEGLGVSYEVFEKLQNDAVRDVQASVDSLDRAARLLEAHGLGTSFRLTSVMLNLHRLGLGPLEDVFWQQMMDFAINHVLRELKHHARIPVPEGWGLVGVADVHGYLKEGQIFACVVTPSGLHFLEGPATISRSPTIHPGDVQVVHAIGRPPEGSPFERESLRNCVVFSTQGSRPLPSCLGGGDLDGDEYVVTVRKDLRPTRGYQPASYDPARRRLLAHKSTMEDVADFVAEFINSDTLGIIAINWLIIADQSDRGILDRHCLTLAALHSDAVDYPKTGEPVPLDRIPNIKFKVKPDWNAPETINPDSTRFYPSQRAIGKLFRAIKLPALNTAARALRAQHSHLEDDQLVFDDILNQFEEPHANNEVLDAVQQSVMRYINVQHPDADLIREIWRLYEYYVPRLRSICVNHTLSWDRAAMLTEEEAIIGTIVAKCSQPRKRKDTMSHLREQTVSLVEDLRNELAGDENVPLEHALKRAWVAFRLSVIQDKNFGARSFGWLALGGVFEAMKEIDDLDRGSIRSSRR